MYALVGAILLLLGSMTGLIIATVINGDLIDKLEMGQENIERLDEIVRAFQARRVDEYGSGVVYAPVGVEGEGYYELPADMDVPRLTPWGVPYRYCPVAPGEGLGGTGTTVDVRGNGETYRVEVSNGFVVRSEQALQADVLAEDVVGLVIAPGIGSFKMPRCNQVYVDDTWFRVPGGMVRAIRRDRNLQGSDWWKGRVVTWYVGPDGTGLGVSEGNPSSIDAALKFWRENGPGEMEIKLGPGLHSLRADLAGSLTRELEGSAKRTLRMVPSGGAVSLRLVDAAGSVVAGEMDLSVDLEMKDIGFVGGLVVRSRPGDSLRIVGGSGVRVVAEGADVEVKQADVSMLSVGLGSVAGIEGSDIETLVIGSGKVVVEGVSTVTNAARAYPIEVSPSGALVIQGQLTVKGGSGLGGVRIRPAGTLLIEDGGSLDVGAVSGSLGRGVYVDVGGVLQLDGGALGFLGNVPVGVSIAGRMGAVDDARVLFYGGGDVGIDVLQGGELVLGPGTKVGDGTYVATWGVRADKPGLVGGEGSVIKAVSGCWAGEAFANSGSASGGYSIVDGSQKVGFDDEASRLQSQMENVSNWGCSP